MKYCLSGCATNGPRVFNLIHGALWLLVAVVVVAHILFYPVLASTIEGRTIRSHICYTAIFVLVPLFMVALFARSQEGRPSFLKVFAYAYAILAAVVLYLDVHFWGYVRFTDRHELFLSLNKVFCRAPWIVLPAAVLLTPVVRAAITRTRNNRNKPTTASTATKFSH